MCTSHLPTSLLKKIHQSYLTGQINITVTARKLHLSRNTLKRHLNLFRSLEYLHPNKICDVKYCIEFLKLNREPSGQSLRLKTVLPELLKEPLPDITSKVLWQAYRENYPDGYSYSQFALYYSSWRKAGEIADQAECNKAIHLSCEDQQILQQWRRSSDRRKWEKAVVIIEAAAGKPLVTIARKIDRSLDKVKAWISVYKSDGIAGLQKKPRRNDPAATQQIKVKKENLMRLIHETPQLHGFNRTSWRLADLSAAFEKNYGVQLSVPTISEYIRKEGYVFRKARKVLTSPDPDFREKLNAITSILANLGPKEKFFSVDEYGPFSVKVKGGRSLVKLGESKTYPQHQKSKGLLICTAALELSTNQMTHFYSIKKDTAEMITLINLLLSKYQQDEKLYFSWDAAAWHASKKLKEYLAIINADNYRAAYHTPLVELAPLPASAQFLNVIESVFSGLARSVIHNSDYPSVIACKMAIDRYFSERNNHFQQYPKRAGNRIWGKERTVAEFRDTNNCKDPNWR